MRLLDRSVVPTCLSKYKQGRDQWSEISRNNETQEVWESLLSMQDGLCAYCEVKIIEKDNNNRHIEHFFPKSGYPQKTFEWANLFGSCNDDKHCGKYKDQNKQAKQIDLNKVCKPDEIDPKIYFIFSSSGKIVIRDGLCNDEHEIAKNTIDIFNLNCSRLANKRKQRIKNEKYIVRDLLLSFKKATDNSIRTYWEQAINQRKDQLQRESFYSAVITLYK